MGDRLVQWADVAWLARSRADGFLRGRQAASDRAGEGAVSAVASPPESADLLRDVALRWRIEAERARAERSLRGLCLRLVARRACDAFALAACRAAGSVAQSGAPDLAARLRTAARAAHTNGAEACGRASSADSAFFLGLAEASLDEAAHLIEVAARFGWLDDPAAEGLLELHDEATRALGALFAFVQGEPRRL